MIFNLIGVNWIFNIFEDYVYITVRTFVFQVLALICMFCFVRSSDDYIIYAGLVVMANVGSNIFNIFYKRNISNFLEENIMVKKTFASYIDYFRNECSVTDLFEYGYYNDWCNER